MRTDQQIINASNANQTKNTFKLQKNVPINATQINSPHQLTNANLVILNAFHVYPKTPAQHANQENS